MLLRAVHPLYAMKRSLKNLRPTQEGTNVIRRPGGRLVYDWEKSDELIYYILDTFVEPSKRRQGIATFRRPHGFVLDGQAATGITTWRRLYELFCQQLARRNPEIFRSLPSNQLFVSRRGHSEFNANRDELRSPMFVAEGIYAEINHSANALRDLMRDLLVQFAIPTDQLRIYLREDRDAERQRE